MMWYETKRQFLRMIFSKNPSVCVSCVIFFVLYFGPASTQVPPIQGPNGLFQPIQTPHGQYTNCHASGYGISPPHCHPPPPPPDKYQPLLETNPLLAAFTLSQNLHLHPNKIPGYNHLDHLPLNPYLALLLSHYGKYTPIYGKGQGLYGYVAANNYHNNQPLGSYKIYEDGDG